MLARLSVIVIIAGSVCLAWQPAVAVANPRSDIVVGLQLEPPHLDPTSSAAGSIDQVLYANVYEGLTRFAEDGSIRPALAQSWRISPDGLRYEFDLQPEVRFHDGSPLTAHSVAFALNRARADDSTNAQKNLFLNIKDIATPSDTSLVIDLHQPDGLLLFKPAWGDAVVVAPDNADALAHTAIGSGPFMLDRWVRGDRIRLLRNPNYWGRPAPLHSVVFRFIADPTAAAAAVRAGEIDVFPAFPAPENLAQLATLPNLRLINGSTEGETILAINNARPPLNQLGVRRAIAHAINRQDIIDGAMFGYGIPIGSHFAPHHPHYSDLTNRVVYDPLRAKAILDETGLGDGFAVTLKLPPPAYARRGGEIIASQLAAIGITARLIPLEWAEWLEEVFGNKDYDLTIVSHTEPFDIGIYGRTDYYFQYEDATLRTALAELDKATNAERRRQLSQRIQRLIADAQVNVFLFQLANAGVADRRLVGIWENAPTQAIDLTQVYWQQ